MKAKSVKLRMLLTLQALFKYSDKNHRISSTKLNEFLAPYGLDCTRRVLADTIIAIQEFGLDVQSAGSWGQRGTWLETRPISEEMLKQLVFAISSNPFLSQEQIKSSLESLRPFVTVHQEPMLMSNIESNDGAGIAHNIIQAYAVVREALNLKRRLIYTINQIGYDRKKGEIYSREQWKTLFTPKCLYQTQAGLYMVGYNHSDKHVEAVDLSNIVKIRLAQNHHDPNAEDIQNILNSVDVDEYIPSKQRELIYRGPVVFKCRGQHLGLLIDKYGMPDEPLSKNKCGHTFFTLHDADVYSDTLVWLTQVPEYGIRIKGPEQLLCAIRTYYQNISDTLISPRLDKRKKDHARFTFNGNSN